MNLKNSKDNKMKKTLVALTVLLAFMLLSMSLYANENNKTPHLTEDKAYNVVLNETLDTEIIDHVSNRDNLKKGVSVSNVGDETVYVRIQLKEFMQLMSHSDIYSDLRYMIDEKGNYFQSDHMKQRDIIDDLNHQLKASKNNNKLVLKDGDFSDVEDRGNGTLTYSTQRLHPINSDSEKKSYFIATQAGDANGQYGRHITIDSKLGDNTILTGGGIHKQRPHGTLSADHVECDLYDPITLGDTMSSPARSYIQLNLNPKHVIPYSHYRNDKSSYSKGVWLYMDTEDVMQPYIYWSQGLKPGETTTTLLDSLSLIQIPETAFEHMLHVELEALSEHEFNTEWLEIPNTLKREYLDSIKD